MSLALEIRGLSKSFGGLPATNDVSLAVEAGERRLIIGPNGAGKTTLFNLITGDLRPDAGSIRLFGEEAAGLRTVALTDQASFLVRLGIGEGLAAVAGAAQMEEYFARRRVVMDPIDPAKLGRVKVLLQGKGVPDRPLRGFSAG